MSDELATYPTLAAAQAATPATAPDVVLLLGYINVGDGGRAYYRQYGTTAPPIGQGRFSLVAGGVTTWYQLDEQTPNELMFGAVASASDAARTAAINNLLAFCRNITPCRKAMIVGSHTITGTLTVYGGQVVEFACPFPSTGSVLTKGFHGDMIVMSSDAKLINPRLLGAGATFTGRGIVINSGANQALQDPSITDMEGPCIEFTAQGAGSRFKCYGGLLQRTVLTNPAVLGPSSEAATTGYRHFYATHGLSGLLIDFNNGNYFTMTACVGDFKFRSNSQRVIMTGCRVVNSNWQVQGTEHSISQCFIAGAATLAPGATYCHVINNTLAGGGNVVNASGNPNNIVDNMGILTGLQDPPPAAPPAIAGRAQVYVEPSNGKLKIRFADGVTKTIVTDE